MTHSLREAIEQRAQAAANKVEQKREQELRDFTEDPRMESLAARLKEMRQNMPHALVGPVAVEIDAYEARKTAATYYRATGRLPQQLVAVHRPDDAA